MNRRHQRSTAVVFIVAILMILFPGCGMGTRPLDGTVTYKSQPVKTGLVTLVPIDGTRANGATGLVENGKYRIEAKFGVVPGRYRVIVEAMNLDKVLVKATTESDAEYAELFPAYTFDQDFSGNGPFVLDIEVPEK